MAKKTVYVVAEECIGCELCVQICDVFKMNADGKSEVVKDPKSQEAKVQEAIDSCPVQCIHWKS